MLYIHLEYSSMEEVREAQYFKYKLSTNNTLYVCILKEERGKNIFGRGLNVQVGIVVLTLCPFSCNVIVT